MAVCCAIKASGERCRAQAKRDSQWCYVHDPDLAEVRRRNNQKGGKRGGRGRPVAEVARIQARLEELAEDVLSGDVEVYRLSVAGQLLNYALRAVSVSLKAKEQEELIERLETVEQRLERQAQERGRRWG